MLGSPLMASTMNRIGGGDPAPDLVQVDRGQDPDRDDDDRRDPDLFERADDRVRGSAARRRADRSCSSPP